MLRAIDIARYLIQLSYRPDSPEESDLLCPLRLQKLLYYVQGWSLALRGRPAFDDEIEAWTLGPVVPEIYWQFKPVGALVIVPAQAGEQAILPSSDARLVEVVWREYGKYSASELIRRTHAERPWTSARTGLAATAKSSAVVSKESLASFFGDEVRKHHLGAIDPREAWAAMEDLDRDNGVPADELFPELLAECPG
jgi:uncharacterized phage-associated protein